MSVFPSPYGDPIVAGVSGTKALINISYASGAPYQWAYELYRNFCQAVDRTASKARGDERMEFDFAGFNWVNFSTGKDSTVIKRRIWNSGPAMNAETELVPYFTSLGEGGGGEDNRFSIDNIAGSYGKGSRAAILPHSDLMVITTEPGGASKALAILNTDTAYVRGLFHSYDEDSVIIESVQLAELDAGFYLETDGWSFEMSTETLVHEEVRKNGGVTFILLGRELTKDYIHGDVRKGESRGRKGESDRGLVDALTRRINSSHEIRVSYTVKADASDRADGRVRGKMIGDYKLDDRTVKTYGEWTARAEHKGSVIIDDHGTIVDWYLLPDGWNLTGKYASADAAKADGAKTGQTARLREDGSFGLMNNKDYWMPWDGKGFLVAQYEYEMIDLYPDSNRADTHKNWGINHPSVSDRVGLIIRPPVLSKIGQWGVTQNESRSTLTGPNGAPLPLTDWANTWFDVIPQEIVDALRAMKPVGKREINPEDVERLRSLIRSRNTEATRKIAAIIEGASEPADGEGVNVITTPDHNGGHINPVPNPNTEHEVATLAAKGKRKAGTRTMSALPVPEFLSGAAWADKGYDPQHFCVVENGGGGMDIYLNEDHGIYLNQVAYYGVSGEWIKKRPSLRRKINWADALDAVRLAYETEVIAKVLWIMDDVKPHSPSKIAERTEPQRMTDALSGYYNVDQHIATRIGGSVR